LDKVDEVNFAEKTASKDDYCHQLLNINFFTFALAFFKVAIFEKAEGRCASPLSFYREAAKPCV